MSVGRCATNEFLLFVNKYKTKNDNKSEYFGQGDLDGKEVFLYADLFRGEKVTFLQGKVVNKYVKREMGRFKIYPYNYKRKKPDDNVPQFKGWLKIGLHVDYELTVWVCTSKQTGVKYMKGLFKIKDAESLYREESIMKASAPTAIDYDVF